MREGGVLLGDLKVGIVREGSKKIGSFRRQSLQGVEGVFHGLREAPAKEKCCSNGILPKSCLSNSDEK